MRKHLLLVLVSLVSVAGFAQRNNFWTLHPGAPPAEKHKSVARISFPAVFQLFDLELGPMQRELLSIVGANTINRSTILSIPNADGQIEEFEMTEASNFEPSLQARFPNIRAYSGRGVTDPTATIKLSLDPEGVQTMVFRTGRASEFIEVYSRDQRTYAVFRSQRRPGQLPWSCTTPQGQLETVLNNQAMSASLTGRSGGNLKTLRLAQSCNAEYSNYFGATSASQVGLVLAAYNATLTRCNGVYEKDLALHLNLIDSTTKVIYYNPSTDPYSSMSSWNSQLQSTLTSVIGESNYDIGHMFGASGGGGNAGCIGCICVNGSKGSGITSPADGIPKGDNFDIDYVVHEVGHQLGANHTFSMSNEGTGVNKEVGSGITIMAYAGITSQDVAPHSIDIFHQVSIAQIQANLSTKTCPVTQSISGTNTAPVITPLTSYTIPKSTPFALTGVATDAEGDPLTYCWEQNDNASSGQTGSSSVASASKASGPNWLSFPPESTPTRIFPRMSTILAGLQVTGPLSGGDAGANIEALSSVARTLNFRLTVRDNAPYSSATPEVGQTAFADVAITVDGTAGPFAVTVPNTVVTWGPGTAQTVTWSVNSTNLSPINCANVRILLSTDSGKTFPLVLADTTPNDGAQTIVLPSVTTNGARIKIEAVGNIFFDISNANFTIGTPSACGTPSGLTSASVTSSSSTVSWSPVSGASSYTVRYKTISATTWTTLASQTTLSANLTGLTPGTTYDWGVLATCSGSSSPYAAAQFTTTVSVCPGAYDVSTNGTIGGAAAIPLNTDIRGLINPKGDVDNYKFTIATAVTITLSLTTLPKDYDLRLLNSSGTQLAASAKSGTTAESISYTAAAGTYYAQVVGYRSAYTSASCYTLRVGAITAAKSDALNLITTRSLVVPGSKETGKQEPVVTVFPNPVQQTLRVNLKGIDGAVEVALFSVDGVRVRSARTSKHAIDFEVSALPAGLYGVSVYQGGTVVSRTKVVKW